MTKREIAVWPFKANQLAHQDLIETNTQLREQSARIREQIRDAVAQTQRSRGMSQTSGDA